MCCSDNGSGISDVSFGLGLSPSDTSVFDWTSVAASGSGPVTVSAAIPDGVWTYVKLRATDRGMYVCTYVCMYVSTCTMLVGEGGG